MDESGFFSCEEVTVSHTLLTLAVISSVRSATPITEQVGVRLTGRTLAELRYLTVSCVNIRKLGHRLNAPAPAD